MHIRLGNLGFEFRGAQEGFQIFRLDPDRAAGSFLGHLAGNLPTHAPDLALEIAHARFPRVALAEADEALLGDLEINTRDPVSLDLARNDESLGDLDLLVERVTGQFDDFHSIPQRRRHGVDHICRRDKEDLGKIKGHFEVVVAEFRILLGIQDFQQGRRRISPTIGTDLIEFIEQDDRIPRLGLAQRLDDASGHGSDVGPAMATNFRFVPNAAQGNSGKGSLQGPGDGSAQGCLSRSRRTHEAENRPLEIALQRKDGDVLDDPILHLFKAVMVLIENLARLADIQAVFAQPRPGQVGDPFEIGSNHSMLGRCGGHL